MSRWLMFLLASAASVSFAQAGDMMSAPSPALECMTPAPDQRGRPEYPEAVYRLREGGVVKVELVFAEPHLAPTVTIESATGADALIESVRRHVERFRVPCLASGQAPVRLRQHYVFIPNDGRKVTWSTPVDEADRAREERIRCITRPDGNERPSYPDKSRAREEEGNVYVRLRFVAPDRAPQVTMLDKGSHSVLAREVDAFAQGYRMPCLRGEPIEANWLFRFVLDPGQRTVLRDATLLQFLRAVRNPGREPVYFDFMTMACPFDVRLTYFRPFAPNRVGEVGSHDPARRPFLDWISTLELDLTGRDHNAVIGGTMSVSIPCGKLDL